MDRKSNHYISFSLIIVICNSLAYYSCLHSMPIARPLDLQALYETNIIFNSFLFPLLLLGLIYIFRNIFLIIISQIGFLTVLLGCSLYYKYFQSVPHINLIKQIYLLPNTSRQILFQLFGVTELIITVFVFLAIGLSLKIFRDIQKRPFSAIFKRKFLIFCSIVLVGFLVKSIYVSSIRPIGIAYRFNSVVALKQHGFTALYFNQLMERIHKKKKIVPWPGKINPGAQKVTAENKTKKNIIILQVESLDTWIIDYQLHGEYVMPYLRLLKKQGAYFDNFFAQHRGGGSNDAELCSLTSLLPLNTHSGFSTADYQKIRPLNKVLAKNGYYSVGIHANSGKFFNRIQSYRLMGFNDFFDQQAFQGEAAGWYSKDKAFFEQTAEILHSLSQPFFAYVITMQSHGPFDNYSIKPNTFDFSGIEKKLQNYILTMHEIDQALSILISQLEKNALLENTILIIYTDHPSELDWPLQKQKSEEFAHSHIPLLIIDPDITPGLRYKVGSHTDIAPTILDLLAIEEPQGWLGTSLLEPGAGKVVLNYGRPYIFVNQGNAVVQDYKLNAYFKFIDYSISVFDSI